ncbi:hypothetical protein D3C87_1975390 [compost metagenome]
MGLPPALSSSQPSSGVSSRKPYSARWARWASLSIRGERAGSIRGDGLLKRTSRRTTTSARISRPSMKCHSFMASRPAEPLGKKSLNSIRL